MTFAQARFVATLPLAGALIALAAAPQTAVARSCTQSCIQAHFADAPTIDRGRRRTCCDAELRALKQAPGLGDGQSDRAFLKTCLADVNPVAFLPGPKIGMTTPVGSTSVCEDAASSSAAQRGGASHAHGGLAPAIP